MPRTISQVFREIADRPETAYTVRISYLEIYNEQMVDLLAGSGVPAASGGMHPQGSTASLNVVEDKTGTATVRGLRICLANSEEEALNFLFDGETNRSISEHQLNRCSTRYAFGARLTVACVLVLQVPCDIHDSSRVAVEGGVLGAGDLLQTQSG